MNVAVDEDEICRICNEARSAHVATAKGALTHPREARGEGAYRVYHGTAGFGLMCSLCGGPCSQDHPTMRVEFIPTSRRKPRRKRA
jgi:putative component of toxin-antitoxin plasmid stabilization module